jgi:hypothetical protein
VRRISRACPSDHQPRPGDTQQRQVGGGKGAERLMGAAPGNEWHSLTREAACHKEQSRRPRRVRTTANKWSSCGYYPFRQPGGVSAGPVTAGREIVGADP